MNASLLFSEVPRDQRYDQTLGGAGARSEGALMHRIFQGFIDRLADSVNEASLGDAMAEAAAALGLPTFAYLCMPQTRVDEPRLISTYPRPWTVHYVESRYERLDPVIRRALSVPEPFEWGLHTSLGRLSKSQRRFFDEAACFGIRCGLTIPIHDGRGPVATVTFAGNTYNLPFRRSVENHVRVLQLMAMYFHAHARNKLAGDRMVDGVVLSPREHECLQWAAVGKSAWDIGAILGISRRTVVFHLENAKMKLGVRSICQAVARLAASNQTMH